MAKDRDRCPVVLLSHGTGGGVRGLEWLAHRLARRGFVALGVNHHGNTFVEPYRPEGFLCWWERAPDLSALLDQARDIPSLADRLDFNRVYAAGFSLGGHTVAALLGGITEVSRFQAWAARRDLGRGPREFPDLSDRVPSLFEQSAEFRASCARQSRDYADARIRAALLLAPAPPVRALTDQSLARITVPVHIVVGGNDTEAPAAECAVWLHERLPASRLTMLAPEIGHGVFLPETTEEDRRITPDPYDDAPGVDRASIHDTVAGLAADLFETT